MWQEYESAPHMEGQSSQMTLQHLSADTPASKRFHFQSPNVLDGMIPCAEKNQGPAAYDVKNVGLEEVKASKQ